MAPGDTVDSTPPEDRIAPDSFVLALAPMRPRRDGKACDRLVVRLVPPGVDLRLFILGNDGLRSTRSGVYVRFDEIDTVIAALRDAQQRANWIPRTEDAT